MWPHTVVLRLSDLLVCVGSDDEGFVRGLDPWVVDEERTLVDFALELHPDPPTTAHAPRPLANLRHGSARLVNSLNQSWLRAQLLELLGSLDRRLGPHEVRVDGMVLERNGTAVVFPYESVSLLALRRLEQLGFRPEYSLSVAVDVVRAEVVVGPSLGSDVGPRRLALAGVWLMHRYPDEATTTAIDVARLLGNLDSVLNGGNADELLTAAVGLRGRVPVRYLAPGRAALENELTALAGGELQKG